MHHPDPEARTLLEKLVDPLMLRRPGIAVALDVQRAAPRIEQFRCLLGETRVDPCFRCRCILGPSRLACVRR